jgi:hypothetical protein
MAQITIANPDSNGSNTPPGGWSCLVHDIPEGEKRAWQSTSYANIKKWVESALVKHGLDPATAEERILATTVLRLKREGHGDWIQGIQRRKRTLAEHWRGTKAYATVLAREAKGQAILTLPKEAERRAGICAGGAPGGAPCPQNKLVSKSAAEKAEDAVIAAKVEGRTTAFDDLLGTCNACSCELKTIVHVMPPILGLESMSTEEWNKHPSFCWKRQLLKKS